MCAITASDVDTALSTLLRLPSAVYVTSPDYLGNIADIRGISEVCLRHGVPLIVDNAHGAYLGFTSPVMHPIALGAAMCADSAHKTLPALTGAAYLHISRDYPEYIGGAKSALSIFASTSPSYLILRSLDICNARTSGEYPESLARVIEEVGILKEKIRELGLTILSTEPLKITLAPNSFGYTGEEIADILRKGGIECEFSDYEYTVLMISPNNTSAELSCLYRVLSEIKARVPITREHLSLSPSVRVLSMREAIFAPREVVDVECAIGRICATPTVSCPPAIPIAVSGEVITEDAVSIFKKYGISTVEVVK